VLNLQGTTIKGNLFNNHHFEQLFALLLSGCLCSSEVLGDVPVFSPNVEELGALKRNSTNLSLQIYQVPNWKRKPYSTFFSIALNCTLLICQAAEISIEH
jgi:hypothetical protein